MKSFPDKAWLDFSKLVGRHYAIIKQQLFFCRLHLPHFGADVSITHIDGAAVHSPGWVFAVERFDHPGCWRPRGYSLKYLHRRGGIVMLFFVRIDLFRPLQFNTDGMRVEFYRITKQRILAALAGVEHADGIIAKHPSIHIIIDKGTGIAFPDFLRWLSAPRFKIRVGYRRWSVLPAPPAYQVTVRRNASSCWRLGLNAGAVNLLKCWLLCFSWCSSAKLRLGLPVFILASYCSHLSNFSP